MKEATAGGQALKAAGYSFDVAHTSVLQRAQKTLATVLEQIGQPELSVQKTWRLNERHYGGLTGLNKAETAEKHGEEQVQVGEVDRVVHMSSENPLRARASQKVDMMRH